MATYKKSKPNPRKTVRRHRKSTSGKISVPVDVRSDKDLPKFRDALKKNGLTIILVYATWCPHCHTLMPHFDEASKNPANTVSTVKVDESMLDKVNNYVKTNINSAAKPIQVNGYPSIILVNKKAEKVTDIEPVRNTKTLEKVMQNAGPLAEDAKLNSVLPVENVANSNKNSKNSKTNKNSKNITLESINEVGMANGVIPENNKKLSIKNATAPSPINIFSASEKNSLTKNKTISKEEASIAEEITSMTKPLSEESEPVSPPSIEELEPAEKVSGGGRYRKGGSLMSAMARTTYTLAPAAALLATAAFVMKGKTRKQAKAHNKPRRAVKKSRKNLRRK
jgi:thiol-disulfide isomerase/thioredoxin